MSISPSQCRAARALLELDQNELAARASVSRGVIIDFEKGRRTPGANNLAAIARALQAAGVTFIDGTYSGSGGPGVRLFAPAGASIDTNEDETIQYKDMFENDAHPGAGG
ncbi:MULTISPECIES: helix-turn-helix transcriptional regulator [unclassified Rhizobium]|uniref:helix-turn-helix transcriptional regulator n=1 Tax=Rhizobium sp. BG4 TaxID=2613770 RepID=UPI00193DC013|nr:helix-turn-helix transcriptional regulator [Rhizobium sp. BG4]QRM47810.1 helix-turn-helix transcriptional regulator [Rhizobium sp. BG4]